MNTKLVREEDVVSQIDLHNDEYLESWLKLIETKLQDRNYRKAEDCIRMALCMSPHCEKLWLKLGNLLKELNQFNEAEKCYSEAMKIDPDDKIAQKFLNSLKTRKL